MNHKLHVTFNLNVHLACEVLKIYNPSRSADIDGISAYGTKRGYITKKQAGLLGGMFKHTVPDTLIGHTWWHKSFINEAMDLLLAHRSNNVGMVKPSPKTPNWNLPPTNKPSPQPGPYYAPDLSPNEDDGLSDYDRAMGVMK
jgi:hypothetical protein